MFLKFQQGSAQEAQAATEIQAAVRAPVFTILYWLFLHHLLFSSFHFSPLISPFLFPLPNSYARGMPLW